MSSNCTSGCKTKDHATYAECLQDKSPSVAQVNIGADYKVRKKWDTELREYRAARSQGIQPRSTQLKDIRSAVSRSNALGRPVKDT